MTIDGESIAHSAGHNGPNRIMRTYLNFLKNYDFLASFLRFRVVDSIGNEWVVREGNSIGRQFLYGKTLFDPVDENTKEITITPYLLILKQGEWIQTDWEGNLFDVDVSQYEVLDIKFDSFKVKLP